MTVAISSAAGLAAGYALDRWLGDPRDRHPVAAFGRFATWWEERLYDDSRPPGVALVIIGVGSTVAFGAVAATLSRRRPVLRFALTTAATWAVLGGRSLEREAATVGEQLEADDLEAARRQIRNLVGRDPETLDADGLARACVESVAENTSDAVVAPLLFGAVLGLPGLLGYRAINTLDAMVGHRTPTYAEFGWAAARLDDLANWVPARASAALAAFAAPLIEGSPVRALTAVLRDARRHPSPNAGVVEAAFAGAMGVRLGGINSYGGETEDRGELGRGSPPAVTDIARANRLARVVGELALVGSVAWRLVRR